MALSLNFHLHRSVAMAEISPWRPAFAVTIMFPEL
jgi:hypothetical protein